MQLKKNLKAVYRLNGSDESGKVTLIDVILLAVVVISAGFIGVRLLNLSQDENVSSKAGSSQPVASSQAVETRLTGSLSGLVWNLPGKSWQGFISGLKSISDWTSISELTAFKTQQSEACAMSGVEQLMGSGLSDPALGRRVSSGELDFFIEPTGRRCVKQGQKLDLFFYSNVTGEPYVSKVGVLEIVDVYSIPAAKVPSAFARKAGFEISKFVQDVAAIKKYVQNDSGNITLIRVKPLLATGGDAQIPTAHMIHTRLSNEKIRDVLTLLKKVVVVDVRSVEEANADPIAHAIRAPYAVSSGSSAFTWSIKNSDLSRNHFEVEPVIRARDLLRAPVILVGSGQNDGRPIWVLNSLDKIGINHAYWFAGSAGEFKAAIASSGATVLADHK